MQRNVSFITIAVLAGGVLASGPVFGQTLALSSGTAAVGGNVALTLSLASPAGSEPAALQWTFSSAAGSLTNFSVVAGAAATAAGKTLTCNGDNTAYKCVLAGMNVTPISNGVVATVSATLASANAVNVAVSSSVGATAGGASAAVTATGASIGVTSTTTPATLTSITCPASLNSGAAGACTVALSGAAATGGAVVTLTSSSGNLTVPASVTVAAGATSANVTVSVKSITSNEAANVTAVFGGVSKAAAISLVAGAAATPQITGLQCTPSTLSANSSASCSVTLSSAAQAGGAVVAVSSASNLVTAPATTTVAAGATSGTFAVTAGAVSTSTAATLTASYGGGGQSVVIALNAATTAGSSGFLLHGVPAELSGTSNGSVVTAATAPAGFTGAVVANSGGAINFVAGKGLYFLNCCSNTSRSYIKYSGATVGTLFGGTQGGVSFNLTSRYTFAQRLAAGTYRTVFHVRDANGDQFYFSTVADSGKLRLNYVVGGQLTYYFIPAGSEDAMFGNGVTLQVAVKWANGVRQLYLNGNLVQSSPYTASAANWSSASTFDIGAYEYLNFGGYNVSDDIIGEFTIDGSATSTGGTTTPPATPPPATPPPSTTPSGGTASTPGAVLQIQGAATEIAGVNSGAVVTPTLAPAGFTGTVVNTGGSVNFAPAGGVYFLNCCAQSSAAYYKFGGTALGSIFDLTQGQITFYLTSRNTFAARQTTSFRTAFDVRDNDSNNHLFYFLTSVASNKLVFSYRVGGEAQFYQVPAGTEDATFGVGVTLKVTITWDGATAKLYLNDALVQSGAYTKATPNWSAASNFDFGAYEYGVFGGYDASDDIIRGFTVSH